MTFEQNLTFGLVMAGIALFSSVFSVVVTGIVNHVLTNRRRQAEKQERLLFLQGEMDSITAKLDSIAEVVTDEKFIAEVGLPPRAVHRFAGLLVEAAKRQMRDASEEDYDYLIGFLQSYNADMKGLTDTFFIQMQKVVRNEGEGFLETEVTED